MEPSRDQAAIQPAPKKRAPDLQVNESFGNIEGSSHQKIQKYIVDNYKLKIPASNIILKKARTSLLFQKTVLIQSKLNN